MPVLDDGGGLKAESLSHFNEALLPTRGSPIPTDVEKPGDMASQMLRHDRVLEVGWATRPVP